VNAPLPGGSPQPRFSGSPNCASAVPQPSGAQFPEAQITKHNLQNTNYKTKNTIQITKLNYQTPLRNLNTQLEITKSIYQTKLQTKRKTKYQTKTHQPTITKPN